MLYNNFMPTAVLVWEKIKIETVNIIIREKELSI